MHVDAAELDQEKTEEAERSCWIRENDYIMMGRKQVSTFSLSLMNLLRTPDHHCRESKAVFWSSTFSR